MSSNPVIASLANPMALETLYQRDRQQFAGHLLQAQLLHPQAQILKFWQARLDFQARSDPQPSVQLLRRLPQLLGICAGAYLLARLPVLAGVDPEWFFPRALPWIVLAGLALLAVSVTPPTRTIMAVSAGGFLLVALALLALPDHRQSDSVTMAMLHAPVLLWCLLALSLTGDSWREVSARVGVLHYCGEIFILTTLILLGGIVLSGISMGLFSLIGLEIEEWYLLNVGLAGAVSAPLVAAFVYEHVLARASRFANYIANIFAPLFLLMLVTYLAAMVIAQKSPYSDRDFLIMFNALLLLVLGITLYSIGGRRNGSGNRLIDVINMALVSVTLVVDLVALSAIVYRLSAWGLTPNRLVVGGINLLVFCHLLLILCAYVRSRRAPNPEQALQRAATDFLPVYGAWASIVLILLPPLFGYR